MKEIHQGEEGVVIIDTKTEERGTIKGKIIKKKEKGINRRKTAEAFQVMRVLITVFLSEKSGDDASYSTDLQRKVGTHFPSDDMDEAGRLAASYLQRKGMSADKIAKTIINGDERFKKEFALTDMSKIQRDEEIGKISSFLVEYFPVHFQKKDARPRTRR